MLFAELEMHANASILTGLSNVMVIIGGATVPGIFRNPSTSANLGMGAADTGPTVTIASGVVPDAPVDQLVVIANVAYTILAAAPDGTGLTLLTLTEAA